MMENIPVGTKMSEAIDVPGIDEAYVWNEIKPIEEGEPIKDYRGVIKVGLGAENAPESTDQEMEGSILENIFRESSGGLNFDKFISFAGLVSQAESFRGKKEESDKSSASGLFHFLTENGGDFSKNGAVLENGGYDKDGNRAHNSFDTAKNRLKSLVGDDKAGRYGYAGELIKEIMTTEVPSDLTREQQALLMYADLKMRKGTDLKDFLEGDSDGEDIYKKFWVTEAGSHTNEGIGLNWQNAKTRDEEQGYGNVFREKTFFGLTKPGEGTVLRHRRGGTIAGNPLAIIRGQHRMI
jgi:hypothetical protein